MISVAVLGLGGLAVRAATRERLPPPWLEQMASQIRDELAFVKASDGIDAEEATAIAGTYLSEYIIGGGAVTEPTKQADRWQFGTRMGLAGTPSDDVIIVDARNGAVWAAGYPRFPDFATFRARVVKDFTQKRMQ